MALLRIDDPTVEPVVLEDAKLHLRLDTDDDDTLVCGLITSARMHIEQLLGRALITQTWIDVRDAWPRGRATVRLSPTPVQDVVEVRILDGDGVADVLSAAAYDVDRISEPARLKPSAGAVRPAAGRALNGIEIEFVAGYGDTPNDVPQPLRQAILLLVAHWYEQREPVSIGASIADVPQTVAGLIAPYRTRQIA